MPQVHQYRILLQENTIGLGYNDLFSNNFGVDDRMFDDPKMFREIVGPMVENILMSLLENSCK
jgi:hypothetical protein